MRREQARIEKRNTDLCPSFEDDTGPELNQIRLVVIVVVENLVQSLEELNIPPYFNTVVTTIHS